MEDCSILRWMFTTWNWSETMRYETMLPINKTYFLFTVDMLFYLTFFFIHNAGVCIFAKTTALFNYIFIQDKSIVFTLSINLWSIRPSDFKQNAWYPKFDMENSASIRKPSPLCFCTVLFLCVYVLNIYQDTFCFQNFPP